MSCWIGLQIEYRETRRGIMTTCYSTRTSDRLAMLLLLFVVVVLAFDVSVVVVVKGQPAGGGGATTDGGEQAVVTSTAQQQDRPVMTRQECTSELNGVVVGDIGDGAISRDDYLCESSGEPPLANIVPAEGEPIPIEGEVCCGVASSGSGSGSGVVGSAGKLGKSLAAALLTMMLLLSA